MENKKLNENIRKTVKEKIAVSNIRKEFDMKKSNNKKLIYTISSMCAVFVLCLGIAVNTNMINNKPNIEISKNDGLGIVDLEKEKLSIELNINKLDEMEMLRLDADIKEIDMSNLPEKFEFINNIIIPTEYRLECKYNIYTRESKTGEYNILHDYKFYYTKNSINNIIIAFSEIDKPVRDYFIEGNNKISKIGDVELIISQYKEMYIASFSYKNINFDIETTGVSESELVSLLQSIINQVNIYNNPNYSKEDKDTGEKEPVKDITNKKYPECYGGRYVDNNGSNVIWICENNEANRKEVCKFLGITESKTIFKKAQYSYNYLEELQSKISQKMSNKEIPFVTSSALSDYTNNIKVTVTSNKEEDLKKLKELDTIGGAIEIEYNEDDISKKDLLVKE